MGAKHYFTARAMTQVVLTVLTLGTAVAAFIYTLLFQNSTVAMNLNFRNDMLSENEPCVRNTMPDCSNLEKDTCYVAKPWCCPNKYYCQRSPVVGLYCQHSAVQCGNFEWCRDFADISGQCKTKVCQEDMLVERMTQYAFICSALGVLIDIIDLVTFCACPDAVIFKAVTNMCSSCIKWVAFGVIVGSGAKEFMQELIEARCYNNSGMEMVRTASEELLFYIILQVASAVLSLILAPLSAYFGGKLIGVPYVK
jgi:hypothetical protein